MSEPTASDLLKEKVFAAYQSRKFTAIWDIVQAQMQINIAAESRVGDLEIEIARLTTLVAEGERIKQQAHERTTRDRVRISEQRARIAQLERREALLTELYWAILNLDAVFDGVEEEEPGGIEERKREAVLRSNRAWGAIDWLGSEEPIT